MNHYPASFAIAAALALAGCGTAAALALSIAGCGTTGARSAGSTRATKHFTQPSIPSPSDAAPSRRHVAAHTASHRSRSSTRQLAYSSASNSVVQPQPAAGSCHAIGSGLYSRPDPSCTPGALNPAVTQATIDRTICVSGWTETVRPPESVTEREKAASMAAYGDTGSMAAYEYDHFVPLELGGATNDPRNLWPEPGASPNPKDAIEDSLREAVCNRQISLARAQREIVRNWTVYASRGPTRRSHGPAVIPKCTVTASYSNRYHDYDVYVHSNQPDRTVTVSDADGHSDTWHTDDAGFADVYFRAGGFAPGRRVTARVGTATCSMTL
jgi:hypothetical protein